jgi:acyl carrier protein
MDGSDDRELIGGRFGSIQEIVCKTLSLTLEEVTAASSFLQLGGDSLTAIEVVARCRSVGLIVRIADLMKCRTLKKVASLTLINDENLG